MESRPASTITGLLGSVCMLLLQQETCAVGSCSSSNLLTNNQICRIHSISREDNVHSLLKQSSCVCENSSLKITFFWQNIQIAIMHILAWKFVMHNIDDHSFIHSQRTQNSIERLTETVQLTALLHNLGDLTPFFEDASKHTLSKSYTIIANSIH